jgi:hypothetical protein
VFPEHRKNAQRFPVLPASHQRFVGAWRLQAKQEPVRVQKTRQNRKGLQRSQRKQKGRRKAGLFADQKLSLA